MELTCSLNVLKDTGTCPAGPSFGTLTLEELSGVDAGKVKVTLDLGFGANDQKFRDLMLNYTGPANTLSDTDAGNAILLSANAFSIPPYGGLFDIGVSGGQGWSATTTGPYSTILSGTSPLSVANFTTKDSLGNLYAAVHIQGIGSSDGGDCDGSGEKDPCVPGMPGEGSLKIGAFVLNDPNVTEVPEPATGLLLGAGLLAVGAALRRRYGRRGATPAR
jgi:hypothetical protein